MKTYIIVAQAVAYRGYLGIYPTMEKAKKALATYIAKMDQNTPIMNLDCTEIINPEKLTYIGIEEDEYGCLFDKYGYTEEQEVE